jgi:hypothetical protein
VLASHVIGLGTRLAVPAIVDDEDSFLVGSGARITQEQLQTAGVYRLAVPGGLGKEVLELLHSRMLGLLNGPGSSQAGEGLVAISGQQQALETGPEGFPLGCLGPEAIELGSVVFQGTGGSRYSFAFRHSFPPPSEFTLQ